MFSMIDEDADEKDDSKRYNTYECTPENIHTSFCSGHEH